MYGLEFHSASTATCPDKLVAGLWDNNGLGMSTTERKAVKLRLWILVGSSRVGKGQIRKWVLEFCPSPCLNKGRSNFLSKAKDNMLQDKKLSVVCSEGTARIRSLQLNKLDCMFP